MPDVDTRRGFEDKIVDELLPAHFDWATVVRSFPLTCVAVAAVTGFVIGRRHGRQILSSVTDNAAESVTRFVDDLGSQGSS